MRLLILVALLSIASLRCRSKSPESAQARVVFSYHPSVRYAPTRASIVLRADDGSGEFVLTSADFLAQPLSTWTITRKTRNSGVLKVRVDLVGESGDTLSSLVSERSLAPDREWQAAILVGPGPDPWGPAGASPNWYTATPIYGHQKSLTTDSLYLRWTEQSISHPVVF
jgi:hypothetical protein